MIATIAAIAEKMFTRTIVAIIWKPLSSDRSDNDRWDRLQISAIVAIAAIIWKPLSSHRSDHSDHMETSL